RYKAIVHPVADEGLAGRRLALGNFIFVVGEFKVLTTGVNIQGLTEVLRGHYRALDMPAGTALAPWGIPADFTRLGRFPEGEVHRVFLFANLVGADVFTGTNFQVVNRLPRQLTVVGKLPRPVVN